MPFISFEDTISKIETACCGAKIKQHLDDVDEAAMLCSGIIEDYEFPIISLTVNNKLVELGEKK
jgi:hypothetical protein